MLFRRKTKKETAPPQEQGVSKILHLDLDALAEDLGVTA